jgi:hypothetical protein
MSLLGMPDQIGEDCCLTDIDLARRGEQGKGSVPGYLTQVRQRGGRLRCIEFKPIAP